MHPDNHQTQAFTFITGQPSKTAGMLTESRQLINKNQSHNHLALLIILININIRSN